MNKTAEDEWGIPWTDISTINSVRVDGEWMGNITSVESWSLLSNLDPMKELSHDEFKHIFKSEESLLTLDAMQEQLLTADDNYYFYHTSEARYKSLSGVVKLVIEVVMELIKTWKKEWLVDIVKKLVEKWVEKQVAEWAAEWVKKLVEEYEKWIEEWDEKWIEEWVNKLVAPRLVVWSQSYIAPHTLTRLFTNFTRKLGPKSSPNIEFSNLHLTMGKGSNIQELRSTDCPYPKQPIHINIGNHSSLAHSIKFKVTNPTNDPAKFTIEDNVFVGIGTTLRNGVHIKSGTPGKYTSIWFGCTLYDCTIGSGAIIGNGARIDKGISIPDDTVVPPGVTIDEENCGTIITMDEFRGKTESEQKSYQWLISLAPDSEDRQHLEKVGPMFKFLESFNDHVLEDNRKFPMMYNLIKKYHPDQYEVIEERENGDGTFININLPEQIVALLYHYFNQAREKRNNPNHEIEKYTEPFTKIGIPDKDTVENDGIVYFIWWGDIVDTEFHGLVVNRSGDEWGSLSLNGAYVDHCIFHAKWPKRIVNSRLASGCIVHGETTVEDSYIAKGSLLHNAKVKSCNCIGEESTIVGVDIEGSALAKQVTVSWFEKGIKIKNSNIGKKVVIRDDVVIEDCNIQENTFIPRWRVYKDDVWVNKPGEN